MASRQVRATAGGFVCWQERRAAGGAAGVSLYRDDARPAPAARRTAWVIHAKASPSAARRGTKRARRGGRVDPPAGLDDRATAAAGPRLAPPAAPPWPRVVPPPSRSERDHGGELLNPGARFDNKGAARAQIARNGHYSAACERNRYQDRGAPAAMVTMHQTACPFARPMTLLFQSLLSDRSLMPVVARLNLSPLSLQEL